MIFLPQDYEAPKTSNNYLKLQDGENRIRILSQPIIGWEDWTPEKKPVRFRMNEKPAKSIDPKKPVKHFWAFVVYNVLEHRIQIMQVSQATIRRAIEALSKDNEWGAPYLYDIKIMKSGEGVDTEYHVNPVPHKPIADFIIEMFNENRCNLDALFSNEDPFAKHWENYTQLGIDDRSIKNDLCIQEELTELSNILDKDLDYKNIVFKRLKELGITELDKIPKKLYDTILHAAQERANKEKIA